MNNIGHATQASSHSSMSIFAALDDEESRSCSLQQTLQRPVPSQDVYEGVEELQRLLSTRQLGVQDEPVHCHSSQNSQPESSATSQDFYEGDLLKR